MSSQAGPSGTQYPPLKQGHNGQEQLQSPSAPPPSSPSSPPTPPPQPPGGSTALTEQEKRLTIETWIRGFALILIVIAIVTYPMYALIVGISGASLSEAIAPITGIAGAIVGYWFGQASRRISSVEGGQSEPAPGHLKGTSG